MSASEVTVTVDKKVARALIELVGGEDIAADSSRPGIWVFPDGFWTWETDEALGYALVAMPDVVES